MKNTNIRKDYRMQVFMSTKFQYKKNSVLTAAISSRGSSQLLRKSEHETLSTTFSC